MKRANVLLTVLLVLVLMTGCTVFKGILDRKYGFAQELEDVNKYIMEDSWDKAGESLADCNRMWRKIKPWMQLEIDHDIINEIEEKLTELTAYLETMEKPAALAGIRFIINSWEDIGSK